MPAHPFTQFGVVYAQQGALCLAVRHVVLLGPGNGLRGLLGVVAVYHQPAHIVQQACRKSCGAVQPHVQRQLAGRGGTANGMAPERIHVQRLAVQLFKLHRQCRCNHQAAQLPHAQDVDGIAHRANAA